MNKAKSFGIGILLGVTTLIILLVVIVLVFGHIQGK